MSHKRYKIVKVGTRCYNNLIIVILERLDMPTISYKPLNLYRQFKTAAQEFPNVAIYFDQPYASFPELGMENTYQTVFEAIQKELLNLQQQVLAMGTR